jgi:acetyl esterase/lipase
MAKAFQAAGVAVAVISYRLGPASAWPAQPQDVAAAFAWVKANVASRGGDPARAFLMGHSSGGHLVAVVGDDPKYVAQFGLRLTDIAGVIPIGSLLDFQRMLDQYTPDVRDRIFRTNGFFETFRTPEVMRDAGPTQHIGPGMPPYLIIMADKEQENPPILSDSKAFVGKVTEAGGRASFVVIPNRTHLGTLQAMTGPDDPAVQAILQFVR